MSDSPEIETARRVLALEVEALGALSNALDARFTAAIDTVLRARGRVVCAGVGKSGHVARKIAATLASTGTPAYFVHPTEASHGDLGMISSEDVVLALSRSGETTELSDITAYCRRFGIPLIGVTANLDSTLGKASNICLGIPDLPEACAETNAPTTSTTLMMALGDALAVALLERRGFKANDFKVFHPGGKLGSMLRTAADLMHGDEELPIATVGSAIGDAISKMSARGFGIVGVVDETGRLRGVVTDGDLRRFLVSGRSASRIEEVMGTSPKVARPSDLAADVLRVMNERKITQVFVVEEGRPIGVIHLHDLLRAGVL